MTTTPIIVTCTNCKKEHSRNVRVIEPETFSPHGHQSVLSQFWCPKCGTINAIRYEFYRDEHNIVCARVKSRLEPIGVAFIHGDEEEKGEKEIIDVGDDD